MSTAATNPDIQAAVVAYLIEAIGPLLAGTPAHPGVWADYAPGRTPHPYAIVTDVTETHAAQSEDPAAGTPLSVIAIGTFQVAFYAEGKQEARWLGQQAVDRLSDTRATLQADDCRIAAIFASRADSAVLGEVSPGEPTVYVRIITFTYLRQFPQ